MFENLVGFAFVDENIENHKEIELEISEELEKLHSKLKDDYYAWLNSKGLDMIMGIVVTKEKSKEINN